MAERGIEVAHSTILRWVTRYVPEFEKRWNRFSRLWPGSSRSRTRPSRSPASSWLIAFASGSSRSVVAVGVVAGPGRRNGRWRSHRSRLGTQNSVIATSMSRVAPEPFIRAAKSGDGERGASCNTHSHSTVTVLFPNEAARSRIPLLFNPPLPDRVASRSTRGRSSRNATAHRRRADAA
jgi:hypothetical protein